MDFFLLDLFLNECGTQLAVEQSSPCIQYLVRLLLYHYSICALFHFIPEIWDGRRDFFIYPSSEENAIEFRPPILYWSFTIKCNWKPFSIGRGLIDAELYQLYWDQRKRSTSASTSNINIDCIISSIRKLDAAIHEPVLRSIYSSSPAPCLYTYICVNSIGLIENCLFTRVSGLCNHAYVYYLSTLYVKGSCEWIIMRSKVKTFKHSVENI